MYNNAPNIYKRQSVEFASPGKLIVMLYDAAIKDLKIADKAILENDIPKAHERLVLCQDIFRELMSSLDKRYPLAEELQNIYDFIISQLIQANLRKDREIINSLLPMVTELRDAWQQAERLSKQQKATGVAHA